MRNVKFRALVSVALAFIFAVSSAAFVGGAPFVDDFILSDPVRNTYVGRSEAADMIAHLQFDDIPAGHQYRQFIARGGALGLIRGIGNNFAPNNSLTREEAIVFVMRLLDYERRAVNIGPSLTLAQGLNPAEHWSLGYLFYASQLGIISALDYQDVIGGTMNVPHSGRPEAQRFNRRGLATREEVAEWLHLALESIGGRTPAPPNELNRVFTFNDWQSISTERLFAVEDITAMGVMQPVNGGFNPQGNVTRQEMARILASLDRVYFDLTEITRETGTVSAVVNHEYVTTGRTDQWTNYFIRTAGGAVDVLQLTRALDLSPASGRTQDAVVYKNGRIGGLALLSQGDMIEFLVQGNEVLYVWVVTPMRETQRAGRLHTVNTDENTITIWSDGDYVMFSMIDGLLRQIDGQWRLMIDGNRYDTELLPFGNYLMFTFINNIVTEISFIGNEEVVTEIRGIVVDNQPAFGFITIIDNDGNRRTFRYFENDMLVRMLRHYDMSSGLSYFTQMFPNFNFDPSQARIRDIEPGHIVFIRPDPEDPAVVAEISAATNYVARYGRIIQINRYPDHIMLHMQFENGQTTWFNVPNNIFISRTGRRVSRETIMVGDWARLLVNEAVVAPGQVLRSVKEIALDGGEFLISNIVRGTVASINMHQRQLVLQNPQDLARTGWTNHRNLVNLNLNNPNIEFYFENRQISLDYVARFLTLSNVTAYIAMENFPGGERIRKVTFREGREEIMPHDTVVSSLGTGAFQILGHPHNITADEGTIVRRHGRLVTQRDILPTDFLSVILTGQGTAAVIDIIDRPDTSQVMITRARVARVQEGVSFTAASIAQLHGNRWVFSPVQREFQIDFNTLFLNENGFVDPDTFIGITDDSVIDNVYTVVTDGARATHVVEHPYSAQSLRGTIFRIDGNSVTLRDVYVHNPATNVWTAVSATNNFINLQLETNTIIARNNSVVLPRELQPGDGLLVMTNHIPTPRVSGMEVTGYIVLVER